MVALVLGSIAMLLLIVVMADDLVRPPAPRRSASALPPKAAPRYEIRRIGPHHISYRELDD